MTLTIGSLALTRANGYVVNDVKRDVRPDYVVGGTPYSHHYVQHNMAVNQVMEWTIPMYLQATTSAGLRVLVKNLNAELTRANTITDDEDGDAVTWDTWPSAPITPGPSLEVTAGHQFKVDVTLRTKSIGYEVTPVVLYDEEAVTSPAVLALGDLAGDAPAPLDIEMVADWNTAVAGVRDFIAAIVPTGDIGDYLYEAEAATGWTLVTDADAGPGAANNARSVDAALWNSLVFDPVASVGRCRVYARAHRTTSESGELGLSEDGVTPDSHVVLMGPNFRWYNVGEFISTGTNNIILLGQGSDAVYVDSILVIPLDDGMTYFGTNDVEGIDSWQFTAAPTFTDVDPVVYSARRYMVGSQLYAPCLSRFLLVAGSDTVGAESQPAIDVSVSYIPQHYTWAIT